MPNMTWNDVGHILIETFQWRIQNYEVKQDMLHEKLLWQRHFVSIKKKKPTHCECQKEAFSAVNYYKPITKYEFLVPNTKSFKSLDLFIYFFLW